MSIYDNSQVMQGMDNHSGLRVYEIAPDHKDRIIEIDTGLNANFPITIGRSADNTIHIGVIGRKVLVPHPDQRRKANGEQVPISNLISRVQATIFRDETGRLRIRDGNGNSSGFGIREGATDKLIRRPWLLGPGAFVKLTPEGGGYRCWLEWPAAESDTDTPTLRFSQWQNENLQEELAEQKAAITALNDALVTTKRESREADSRQDQRIRKAEKKIAQLTVLGAVAIAIFAATMGISSEKMQLILQVLVMAGTALGGGAILHQKNV